MYIGYKLLDSGQGVEHQVSYNTCAYPTSVHGIIVLFNSKQWIKISQMLFSTNSSFWPFERNIFPDKIVSFHNCIKYKKNRIYTVSREPIRLPELQYPVFGI